ncbi:PREDICTED: uncharacterized protein LOC104720524 [Camelina sativa]|uniref:Uncharacterized protein LOC104720524 n=1 Tax=Camelina sativa TaxID=90675 RepID=A0ABM0U6M7_CAMSA|nr:PREDICTED: uncharacterized protein LOC104720524 [Camelina sativa]
MADFAANLSFKAREILSTPSHEGLVTLVDQLFTPRESEEYLKARILYDFCVSNFPDCLTLKLLKIYRFSSDDVVRLRSISHLSETLTENRNNFEISGLALDEIKPLLISCLTVQNPRKVDTDYLRVIVSFVAYNVMVSRNERWEELSDYILLLVNQDPIRAFSYFVDLPSLYVGFIHRFFHRLREEVYKVLLRPEKDRDGYWILALKAAVKMGIQIIDSDNRFDLTREILHNVLKSASDVVWMGMEREFLIRGIKSLESYLEKDAKMCKWSAKQCRFVASFAYGVSGVGKNTKEAAKNIFVMVTKMDKYVWSSAFKLNHFCVDNHQDVRVGCDLELYYQFWKCTPVEVLSSFAASGSDDRSRVIAIRRLYDVVCDHTSDQWEIDVSEIRDLQPLLIKCLKEEGMPESLYRILGQVVFHVAQETFNYEKDPWFDLWDYIASESKAEFKKAVYIFQCLTMQLEFKEFVVPAITNLLPEIHSRLTAPKELLVDNSNWVLTFTGAYCSAIHLLEIKSQAGYVKEIAHKMINSVKELVERGMEVGLVMRAFRDLERIVEKQGDWYMTCEYRFLKGLLQRLYTIKGMKMESKIVLWRINVNKIERSVDDNLKVFPKSEFDWLNQPES